MVEPLLCFGKLLFDFSRISHRLASSLSAPVSQNVDPLIYAWRTTSAEPLGQKPCRIGVNYCSAAMLDGDCA